MADDVIVGDTTTRVAIVALVAGVKIREIMMIKLLWLFVVVASQGRMGRFHSGPRPHPSTNDSVVTPGPRSRP